MTKPTMPSLIPLCLALCLGACAKSPTKDETLQTDAPELEQAGLTESGHWQSAPWTESRWIELPAFATVRVPHGLGRMPAEVHVYLSFVEDDRGDATPRPFFLGAGDIANISSISEDEVTIHNTTRGADYFLRVVLQ